MSRIYSLDSEIDTRLDELFGLKREMFFPIVREVVGARADAVDDDPLSAAGQFAYIFGTRNTRGLFRSIGYSRGRFDGIEVVKHPTQELRIAYQSVDLAANPMHNPKAISGKGPGAERLIDLGQASLFSDEELEGLNRHPLPTITRGMWFVCVSVIGDDVRAEISLASGVSSGNFAEFVERIFIVRHGEWDKIRIVEPSETGAVEFEPKISRK
jgi:hypothetical protein